MIGSTQGKCRVGIIRQSKVAFSARDFNIYVDGAKVTSIKNGSSAFLALPPGQHVLAFGVGAKIYKKIVLDLTPANETNIMCYATANGIEAAETAIDVCAAQLQPDRNNRLNWIIGLILLLLGLSILGVKLTFFIVPIG